MADDITNIANEVLNGFARDLPRDAPLLFEQMVTATLPDAATIAANQLNAARVAQDMCDRLTDREHKQAPMPDLFVDIVTAAFEKLFAEKDFAADLTPAVYTQLLGDTGEIRDDVKDVKTMMQDFLAGEYISLADLKALAANFGEHDIKDQPSLKLFLTHKAEEYVALKTEVDSIEDGLKRLSNLKAAAQDAIARVNLEEVEDLLSRVQEVELEEAAKTAELRAQNALLRGNVDQAYRLFCASADSFAAIDRVEPARRRHEYMQTLDDHCFRFGGEGYARAIAMIQHATINCPRECDPIVWAMCKNAEGVVLKNLSDRTDRVRGAKLLTQSISACQAALEVRTRSKLPGDWAMTQNNLGIALLGQSRHTQGKASAEIIAQSVIACQKALQVFTYESYPDQWAMTQNNLGHALSDQSSRTEGNAGLVLLERSISAYLAARKVYTCSSQPLKWAMIQTHLGTAFSAQSRRAELEKDAQKLLAQSEEAYRAALKVYTHKDHPMEWARTKNNLADTLSDMGRLCGGPEGARLSAQSAAELNAVCKIYMRDDQPMRWAGAQVNLGKALQLQGVLVGGATGADLITQSIEIYSEAQTVLTRVHDPINWAKTQKNISIALKDRASLSNIEQARVDLTKALKTIDSTLDIFDPEYMSYDHGTATEIRQQILSAIDALSDPKS
ncbi:MAG: hypothetical protein ABJ246_07450 [Paracoccaceae bacterium]